MAYPKKGFHAWLGGDKKWFKNLQDAEQHLRDNQWADNISQIDCCQCGECVGYGCRCIFDYDFQVEYYQA